jgi:hypothetical protein
MKSTETINLSDEDVKEAIADWLNKKRPRPVSAAPWVVSVGAGMRSTGFGVMEGNEPYAIISATRELG